MGVIFLLGLSFSLICLAYYSRLASVWPPGPLGAVVFVDLSLLAIALGGLWWGDSVKGESEAVGPLLALALMAGAAFFLLAPLLLPSPPPGGLAAQGLGAYFGGRVWLSLLVLLPGFFLWGAAPPFLAALAFPQDRGLAAGAFPIFSLALVAMALGAMALAHWPTGAPAWLGRLIGLPGLPIFIVGLWLWSKTPPEDRQNLPFWPSASLGLWTGGDRVYGQDILVSPRRAKTLTPSLFLGAVAGAAAATAWAIPYLGADPGAVWPLAPLALVALALGALVLGPLLAAMASPMAALGLDLLALTLVLAFGPRPPAAEISSFLALGAILAPLGALWPLAARVSLVRYGFIPSGLGHVNVWFLGGTLIGLTLTAAFMIQCPLMGGDFYRVALFGSILALAVSWNWPLALAALAGIGAWLWSPWS
jgi:hypothetical protein